MNDQPAITRFEGSYKEGETSISPAAIMECKICWTPYDPAEGDETRQIMPGTPFLALPHDWKCPQCDAPKGHFMVLEDPGAPGAATTAAPAGTADADGSVDDAVMAAAVDRAVSAFREIYVTKMQTVPFCNKALEVAAVGFRPWNGQYLGVIVAPWFMNLVLLPGPGMRWSELRSGDKELVDFASGRYEFIHMTLGGIGGLKRCSLFSMMSEFKTQEDALAVAEAVLPALFDPENREETDRAAEIRRQREDEIEAREQAEAEVEQVPATAETAGDAAGGAAEPEALSRRALFTGKGDAPNTVATAARAAPAARVKGDGDA